MVIQLEPPYRDTAATTTAVMSSSYAMMMSPHVNRPRKAESNADVAMQNANSTKLYYNVLVFISCASVVMVSLGASTCL